MLSLRTFGEDICKPPPTPRDLKYEKQGDQTLDVKVASLESDPMSAENDVADNEEEMAANG